MPFDSPLQLEILNAWWHRTNKKPLMRYVKERVGPGSKVDLNEFWPDPKCAPDWIQYGRGLKRQMTAVEGVGAGIPTAFHMYGNRGTPMTLAYYLGGDVHFGSDTVWVEPVIQDWRKFSIKFSDDNVWWQRSLQLLETSLQVAGGRFLVALPDFGDALTVFSLLRGTENLLLDLVEDKQAVLETRDRFVEVWPQYHQACWDLYRKHFPGDTSWLIWAPGKTYACQCDFSVMISPKLFEEFVVPEIERLGKYLEYIAWHLDGPGELKHLDILLDLPQIKAFQWYQGAGQPSVANWLPVLKKIQAKNKSIISYADDERDVEVLTRELAPAGLMIVPLWLNVM
ncbi:MAG: hypothetical protein PHV34_09390 [Verrucomicrobiae bacterium]|nr:hypothetical protein [Verrucomicrobiae bacterium]